MHDATINLAVQAVHVAVALGTLALLGPPPAAADPCSCAEAASPAAFKRCVRDAPPPSTP